MSNLNFPDSNVDFEFGASGAGFQLFKQKNNISGIYTDATTRDAYFSANADELTRLDENQYLIIKLNNNGSNQVAYQQRASNAWVDVTSLVTGPAGPAGSNVDFTQLTSTGIVPVWNQENLRFQPDGLFLTATELGIDRTIEVPSGAVGGVKFATRGQIVAVPNDLLFDDNLDIRHSVLGSRRNKNLRSGTIENLSSVSQNEFVENASLANTTWTLPDINNANQNTVSYSPGFSFTIYNPTNFDITLNSFSGEFFSDDSTSKNLFSNSITEIFINSSNKWDVTIISLAGGTQAAPGATATNYFPGVVGESGLLEGAPVTQKHASVGVNEYPAIFLANANRLFNGEMISGFVASGNPSQVVGENVNIMLRGEVVAPLNFDFENIISADSRVYLNAFNSGNLLLWGSRADTYGTCGKVLEYLFDDSGFRYYSVYVDIDWLCQSYQNEHYVFGITSTDSPYQSHINTHYSVSLNGADVTINMPANPKVGDKFYLNQLILIGGNKLILTDTFHSGFRVQYPDGTLQTDTTMHITSSNKLELVFDGSLWWFYFKY